MSDNFQLKNDPGPVLPHDERAEMGVLCAYLAAPDIVSAVCEERGVTGAWFYFPKHALIFEFGEMVRKGGLPLDFITLTGHLRDQDKLEQAGGAFYVTELFTYTAAVSNIAAYLTSVGEKYALRRLGALCREYNARSYEEMSDVPGLLEQFQVEAIAIGGMRQDADALRPVAKAEVIQRLEVIEQRYHDRGKIGGLSTGLVDLDRTIDGLKGKHVYVLAGRPGMGKSAIGVNIAEHIAVTVAEEEKQTVAIFSLEMPREQVLDRILFARAEISLKRIRDGFMSDRDFPKLQLAAQALIKSKLVIDDTPGLTIAQFRSRARRAVVKHKARLLVIDYVQIMKGSAKRANENRPQELAEIMQGIRETAKQLDVPVIVLAQLNRAAEDRPQSRPMMADLKEAGAIEEEANVVGLLYRPAYYAKTDAKKAELAEKYECDLDEIDTIAELEIAKHRNGGVGTIRLKFYGELTRFKGMEGTKLYSNNPEQRQGGGEA